MESYPGAFPSLKCSTAFATSSLRMGGSSSEFVHLGIVFSDGDPKFSYFLLHFWVWPQTLKAWFCVLFVQNDSCGTSGYDLDSLF